jgi:hypothetical protein
MLEDYFAKKRVQLGMDREEVLGQVQATLEAWYPGRVRARQLHRGVLYLVTPSAAVAGALRMRQVELLDVAEKLAGERPQRLAISIGQLRG